MDNNEKCGSRCIWAVIGFFIWLIINIRVEAGMGTSFERAIDGMVGGAVLLTAIFLALRFFDSDGQGRPPE
jgi:hypothetical protein